MTLEDDILEEMEDLRHKLRSRDAEIAELRQRAAGVVSIPSWQFCCQEFETATKVGGAPSLRINWLAASGYHINTHPVALKFCPWCGANRSIDAAIKNRPRLAEE